MFLPPPGAVSNLNRPLDIEFPSDLPVSERRDEIMAAIRSHPVVIVCGETGSGKTTQIPKILLEMGRGKAGLIGHTQPRRIAARAVTSYRVVAYGAGAAAARRRPVDQAGAAAPAGNQER